MVKIRAGSLASLDIQNRLLEDAGVATVAGTSFGQTGEGKIRLSFANSEAKVLQALDRIEGWLASLS